MENKNLINCTPHAVTIVNNENKIVLFLEKGTIVPRLTQTSKVVGEILGIPITSTVFGDTIDLPDPVDGTYYVVSRLVLSANPDRKDLLVPNDVVRDEKGNIIGCRSLANN